MSRDEIARFITDPSSGDFEALADRDGVAGAVGEGGLYRTAVAALLAEGVVANPGQRPVLALAATTSEGGSRLVDELFDSLGDEASLRPIKPRGVDPIATRSWLAARQRDPRPVLLGGPASGFADLLRPVERKGLKFRLPAGSLAVIVLDAERPPDDELRERLTDDLALAPDRLWLAWEPRLGATPFFARWNDEPSFTIPHWTRVDEKDGRLVVIDLVHGPPPLETSARGRIAGSRFFLA